MISTQNLTKIAVGVGLVATAALVSGCRDAKEMKAFDWLVKDSGFTRAANGDHTITAHEGVRLLNEDYRTSSTPVWPRSERGYGRERQVFSEFQQYRDRTYENATAILNKVPSGTFEDIAKFMEANYDTESPKGTVNYGERDRFQKAYQPDPRRESTPIGRPTFGWADDPDYSVPSEPVRDPVRYPRTDTGSRPSDYEPGRGDSGKIPGQGDSTGYGGTAPTTTPAPSRRPSGGPTTATPSSATPRTGGPSSAPPSSGGPTTATPRSNTTPQGSATRPGGGGD